MGNRAHVIFTDGKTFSPATYLHWNGGAESVYPFLDELRVRMGGRWGDVSYGAARFVSLVADFFGQDGMSLGIVNGPQSDDAYDLMPYDHGDNGVYLVDVRQDVVRRFTSPNYSSDELIEWTPEQVAREKAEAERSDYRPGLAADFDEMRRIRQASAILQGAE